ncbi:hypothetical protein AB205_0088190, partial [Aquarana catesbeiana]
HVDDWNIGHLNTILDVVERESGITIEGVNTPYLYFGMWKTSFAWHTEDMDLYSINYLHFGEPKSWYSIPPEHGKRLERLAKGESRFFPGSAQSCEAFLRHKMTVISPFILKKYGIPFDKVTQEAGEFMVTFPYGYHAGFNHGFNCAESTNFATLRWIEYGKQAVLSHCEAQSKTDMSPVAFQLRTKPLIPEMCFTTTSCNTELNLSAPFLEEDGTSLLISCRKCNVCVHASCYGVPKDKAVEGWMCSRCEEDAMTQDCCLCTLRGGALQKANDNRWVHVMCAVAIAEAKFVNIAERRPVDISKIPLMRFRLGKDADRDIVLGQTVIAKHKNGRYYQSEVVKLTKETFYEVNFDDGSFSDNLFPEDIVSRDCLNLGPPAAGDIVQVRWTDGLVYGAKFVASHTIQMYQVEFEDGSQLPAKRDDVYTLDEELPKKVKSRLSVASDMRFTEIFTEQEVKQEVKRQRVINSRYREDYIEPALYRAIME